MPAKPLTVLQVLPALEAGGVERGTVEVAGELTRRGHRSLVLSGGGRLVEPLEAAGSRHIQCPIGRKSPLTVGCIRPVRDILRSEQPDIVHVRSRIPAWVTWLAWKLLPASRRPRFITSVHGMYSVSRFSEIMTRGEVVIAVSKTIRNYLLENYARVSADRIRLIYRGVDAGEFPAGYSPDDEWRNAFQREFPATIGRQLLTLPGRITRLKGHLDFLSLIAKLRSENVPVHGLIVGGEHPRRKNYASDVRNEVVRLGLSDEVTFTGHRTDMKEIYAVSNLVFSLSSKPESFGRTVLEALQLGTPVIGYRHGGVGELLTELFPDGAVSLGDVDAAALTARRMLETAATEAAGRFPVPPVESFRLQTMLDQTMQLYDELTDARSVQAEAA